MSDKTYQVLSVEDDDAQYKLLEFTLKGLPLKLFRVDTGAKAIHILMQAKPDLLLLDVTLPDMRGWDVLDELAPDKHLEGVPIIVLTGHTGATHRVIGRLQKVHAYVSKPYVPGELRNTVMEALSLVSAG